MSEESQNKPEEKSKYLNDEILEYLERFVEYHPAKRLSRNLRSLFLEFLMYDGSAEAEYLSDLCNDFDGLFELLDVIDEHQRALNTSQSKVALSKPS